MVLDPSPPPLLSRLADGSRVKNRKHTPVYIYIYRSIYIYIENQRLSETRHPTAGLHCAAPAAHRRHKAEANGRRIQNIPLFFTCVENVKLSVTLNIRAGPCRAAPAPRRRHEADANGRRIPTYFQYNIYLHGYLQNIFCIL